MPLPPPVFNFLSRCCEALNIAFLSMLLSMHFAFKPVFVFPLQFRTLPLGSPRSPSLLLLLTRTDGVMYLSTLAYPLEEAHADIVPPTRRVSQEKQSVRCLVVHVVSPFRPDKFAPLLRRQPLR